MPLPRVVARLNKRFTNRFIEPVVRRFGGFTVVSHVGRKTGVQYETPVYAFDCDEALVVALTYGPSADWTQNVLAAGGALQRDGVELRIESASLVGRSAAWHCLPKVVRVWLRILRVTDFLRVLTTDPYAVPQA